MGLAGKEQMGFLRLLKKLDFEAKEEKLEAKCLAFIDIGENVGWWVIRDFILEIVANFSVNKRAL